MTRAPRIVRRVALAAAALTVCAAAVPVYGVIARAAGLPGGLSEALPQGSALNRSVTVRFRSSVAAGVPWQFRPAHPSLTLHLGETGLAFVSARNTGARAIAGAAGYAVTPSAADRYLVRIECLCRGRQVLAAHESLDLPMGFYIDPAIATDPATRDIREITLTYTFHPEDKPVEEASITPRSIKKVTN